MFGMSIRKFIILSALIVSGCISHPETIAIDFDSGTEDYTPLVRKILAEHPAGEVTIRFGAGTFDFYPEQAAGLPRPFCRSTPLFRMMPGAGGLRITDVSVSKETSWSRSTTS